MVDAVVLGAGVTGLSIARELADRGYSVTIVARDLPEDTTSSGFASPWAGCNWYSFAHGYEDQASHWDAITYKYFGKLAQDHPELCERTKFYTVWNKEQKEEDSRPYYHQMDGVDYTSLTSSDAIPGQMQYGFTLTSYLLNAPAYLTHLASVVRSKGVKILRQRLSALDEAYDLPGVGKVGLVINASGLGAQVLIGVEDAQVHPARGQTVLVKAPGVKNCYMHVEGFYPEPLAPGEPAPPEAAYIIPRPGSDSHVICGGTYLIDNYSTLPSLSTAERILKDCYNLCPDLAGPNGTSWKDIEVVSHQVGLRPSRHGGARLELQEREVGGDARGGSIDLAPANGRKGEKRKVGVVHAYGVGSAGFQNSVGLAVKASDLVDKYFGKTPASASASA